jgi:hypothetical protein
MPKVLSASKVLKGEFDSVTPESTHHLLKNVFSAMSVDNEEWELIPQRGCIFIFLASSISTFT